MNRRLFFQYGLLLPAAPHGYVGQGLGQGVSAGAMGLIPPTRIVEQDIEEFEVDGVPMVFQNTPNTEAPCEMNTYIPDMKALWMAENVIASLHNIYTLRGAPVRDPLRWSKYIGEALYRFGFRPTSCSPRTTGRAGATSAFRRFYAVSATSMPT